MRQLERGADSLSITGKNHERRVVVSSPAVVMLGDHVVNVVGLVIHHLPYKVVGQPAVLSRLPSPRLTIESHKAILGPKPFDVH